MTLIERDAIGSEKLHPGTVARNARSAILDIKEQFLFHPDLQFISRVTFFETRLSDGDSPTIYEFQTGRHTVSFQQASYSYKNGLLFDLFLRISGEDGIDILELSSSFTQSQKGRVKYYLRGFASLKDKSGAYENEPKIFSRIPSFIQNVLFPSAEEGAAEE